MSGIFGWDLPPGVSISDIPGNRPEDEAWEKIYNDFWDKERLTKTHNGIRITDEEYAIMEKLFYPKNTDKRLRKASEVIDNYIMAAIEYGIEVGEKGDRANYEAIKHEDSEYHQWVRNPKLRAFFKAQRQLIKSQETARKQERVR